MHPQSRLFTHQLFLDFDAIVFPELPLKFFQHDSQSNLAESLCLRTRTRPDYLANCAAKNMRCHLEKIFTEIEEKAGR